MKPDRLIAVSTPKTLANVDGGRNFREAHHKRQFEGEPVQKFARPGKRWTVNEGPGRDPPHRFDSFEPYPIL